VVDHVALGTPLQPVGRARCHTVRRIAAEAGSGGRVAAALRAPARVLDATAAVRPGTWRPSSEQQDGVLPGSPGTLTTQVRVDRAGRYEVWVGGSFRRKVDVRIARARLSDRSQLNHEGQWVPMGEADLRRGTVDLDLRYHDADLHPGSGEPPYPLGPLALTPADVGTRVIYMRPQQATRLCGRSLDWIEALAG
jgi:hypothetical protein